MCHLMIGQIETVIKDEYYINKEILIYTSALCFSFGSTIGHEDKGKLGTSLMHSSSPGLAVEGGFMMAIQINS